MSTLTTDSAEPIARKIVLSLLGGRIVSPPVRVTDEYPLDGNRVLLSGRPVQTVHSVQVGDDVWTDYTLGSKFVLTLGGNLSYLPATFGACCSGPRRVVVDYTYGMTNLPEDVQRAIDVLAEEMVLSATNPGECRLPDRVTNVTRQGISWTVIDPQDFLDNGRTGIVEIDMIIKAHNPGKAKRRARFFGPGVGAPAVRRSAQ